MEKKLLVSFLLAVSILSLAAVNVSAIGSLGTITNVEVNGVNVASNPAIVAGDTVTVRVDFSSLVNVSDVTLEAEIQSNSQNVRAETSAFVVETGNVYTKSLSLNVPFDLKDVLSGDASLSIKIVGSGFRTDATYTLRVQRQTFNADIISVSVPQTVNAGELFPVDVAIKNLGYNNLNNVVVTARIPALGVQRTAYFGDIVAVACDKSSTAVQNYGVDITRKCNENNQDTTAGRLFLQLPWDVKTGDYTLELTVDNADTTSSKTVQISVENAFSSGNFIVSGNQLLIVNPTNQVVVYRLAPEATGAVTVSLSQSLVSVPAGSSNTVTVDGTSNTAGAPYTVDIFNVDGSLLGRAQFTTNTVATSASSPIVVLTIILAIIFIVLLVVLIVLIGKKPEKSEEFGESYY